MSHIARCPRTGLVTVAMRVRAPLSTDFRRRAAEFGLGTLRRRRRRRRRLRFARVDERDPRTVHYDARRQRLWTRGAGNFYAADSRGRVHDTARIHRGTRPVWARNASRRTDTVLLVHVDDSLGRCSSPSRNVSVTRCFRVSVLGLKIRCSFYRVKRGRVHRNDGPQTIYVCNRHVL